MKNQLLLKIVSIIIFTVPFSFISAQNLEANQFLENVKETYADMESIDVEILYQHFNHYNSSINDIKMTSNLDLDKNGNMHLNLNDPGRLDYEFTQKADDTIGIFRRGKDEFQETFVNTTYRLQGVGRSIFSDISYLFYPNMRDSTVYQMWTGDFDLSLDTIYYSNDTLLRISFERINFRNPDEIEEIRRHADSIASKYLPIDQIPQKAFASRLEFHIRYYFNIYNYLLTKKETDYNDDVGVSTSEEWIYNYTFN